MKLLSFLTLAALLTLSACSHNKKSCCGKDSCSKDESKSCCKDADHCKKKS